jgi:hypothetical protein
MNKLANSYIKKAHSYRLVAKKRLSSVVKVQVRFVAKDRRDICDQPGLDV